MTKLELIDQVSKTTGITKKETALIINEFISAMKEDIMEGNKVVISNFGTFYKKDVEPFKLFNPRTGEEMLVEDMIRIYFTSSKNFRNKE